jgi:hypothetical protein
MGMAPTILNKVECSAVLLRALIRSGHYNKHQNKPAAGAFILRENETGLSVDIQGVRPLKDTLAQFKKVFAVISWHSGRVRDIRWGEIESEVNLLDIIHTPTDSNPAHADLNGLPHPTQQLADAEFVSGILAGQARLVWSPEETSKH